MYRYLPAFASTRRSCLAVLVSLLLVPVARAQDEPAAPETPAPLFPDPQLEAVVRSYVFEKHNNEEPLTEDDVKNISQIVGRGKGIQNLEGLQKCRSLALVELADNEIADLGPVSGLNNLQSVDFANNKITEISALAGLTGLQYVQLAGNQVEDVSPLAGLENLRSLYLSGNHVQDLAPIAELKKLWSLYLDGNPLQDLGPIAGLTRVDVLDLRDTGISDVSAISEFTELKYLMLNNNQIADLSVLVAMARKDAEGDMRFAPFVRIYLAGNPLSDEAKTAQVETLRSLGCRVFLEEE